MRDIDYDCVHRLVAVFKRVARKGYCLEAILILCTLWRVGRSNTLHKSGLLALLPLEELGKRMGVLVFLAPNRQRNYGIYQFAIHKGGFTRILE